MGQLGVALLRGARLQCTQSSDDGLVGDTLTWRIRRSVNHWLSDYCSQMSDDRDNAPRLASDVLLNSSATPIDPRRVELGGGVAEPHVGHFTRVREHPKIG